MLCWETYGFPVFRGCDFPFSARLACTLLCTGTAVSACCCALLLLLSVWYAKHNALG